MGEKSQTSELAQIQDKQKNVAGRSNKFEYLNELLLDSLPHFAMIIRKDRTILAANRIARAVGAKVNGICWRDFGQSKYISDEDKKYINDHEAIPPKGTHCHFCLADEAIKKQKPTSAPCINAWNKISNIHWIPLSKDTYLHYAIDITEQKKVEWRLIKEKEKLEQYLAISKVMFAIVDADENIALINKKGCEILGYKEKELIGKNWFDTVVPKKRRGDIKEVFNKLMAGNIQPVEHYQNPLLTKDGVEKTISFRNSVIKDHEGKVTGVLFSAEDVTERIKMENKMNEFYKIINKSHAVAFTWRNDKGWPVEFVSDNVSKIFGYAANDFLSGMISYEKIIHPDDLSFVADEVKKYSKQTGRKEFVHMPYRIIAKDGSVRWIGDKTSIKRDDDGKITHYHGIIEDITERKQMEEEMGVKENAIDSSINAIVITDLYGIVTYVNVSFLKMWGYEDNETVIGMPVFAF